jgi:pimeloyl-ACP methyl ester carboxylesterase
MGIALVHGCPETAAVWGPLISALGRYDVVCLSPPGFGAPCPERWVASLSDYQRWLISELEQLGSPVDLVGHDWGGVLAATAAMTRPDLLRSWCTDVLGLLAPGYVWHERAQVWQTVGAGEAAVAETIAAGPDRLAARLDSLGMRFDVATEVAGGYDEAMGRCILALYRSAAQPVMAELGRGLPAAGRRPGLAVIASADPFVGTEDMCRRSAELCGARVEVLEGLGHWWMVQDPVRSAETLGRFWRSDVAR